MKDNYKLASISLLLCAGLLLLGLSKPQQSSTGVNFSPVMIGTTGSIGGSLLLVNTSVSGTASISGAIAGQACIASASDGTEMVSANMEVTCTVTSANTATVRIYALLAGTPTAKTYNVRVVP